MLNWKDFYAQELVREELLREAKQQRLVSMFKRNLRDERKKARDQLLEQLGKLTLAGEDVMNK